MAHIHIVFKRKNMQLSGFNKVYAEVSLPMHFPRKNTKVRAEHEVQMSRFAQH